MSYIKIQSEDRYIYDRDGLLHFLYSSVNENSIIIDFSPEGPCARSAGLYLLLDEFCNNTGYDSHQIEIHTANMIEQHSNYKIVKKPSYWFEISLIQEWIKENSVNTNSEQLIYHFGNFMGRSRWPRLWLGAWLHTNHADKTLQTFHGGFNINYRTEDTDGVYDWLGLEDLHQFDCDIFTDVVKFLEQSPKTIEQDFAVVKNTDVVIDQPSYYPLQHPANLNIVHYYKHIFVDIIIEPNMGGNCFLSTEKMWRCIIAKRPFIIMSNRDHLHHLHQLGFKTFWDFWDESYDGFENQTRIKQIQALVDKLSKMPIAQCKEMLYNMNEILEHNYQHFLSFDSETLKQVSV